MKNKKTKFLILTFLLANLHFFAASKEVDFSKKEQENVVFLKNHEIHNKFLQLEGYCNPKNVNYSTIYLNFFDYLKEKKKMKIRKILRKKQMMK